MSNQPWDWTPHWMNQFSHKVLPICIAHRQSVDQWNMSVNRQHVAVSPEGLTVEQAQAWALITYKLTR